MSRSGSCCPRCDEEVEPNAPSCDYCGLDTPEQLPAIEYTFVVEEQDDLFYHIPVRKANRVPKIGRLPLLPYTSRSTGKRYHLHLQGLSESATRRLNKMCRIVSQWVQTVPTQER